MDKFTITIKEGRSGIEMSYLHLPVETSTLIERALAARLAARLDQLFKEEKANLLKALKGVAGALRPEDIAMLEGSAKPEVPEK